MPDPTRADRSRTATWLLRAKIIALGLSIGIGARWIKSTWDAYQQPGENPPSSSRPESTDSELEPGAKK